MRIKTVFLGSNWESVEILKEIHKDEYFEIVGVITQEDKPVGRKQVLTPTVVKEYAVKNNIPVFHTNNNEDNYKKALDIFSPELVVCVAFGEIIPGFFLEYPKYKAINVHFSILPKYRGAVPIQMAILHGEKETGVTFVQMVEHVDAGGILQIFKEEIRDNDTNLSLRERLVKISAINICKILRNWVEGKIPLTQQNLNEGSVFFRKDIDKENAQIRWNSMDAEYIERMVRAFVPWPVAWTMIDGKRVKIYEVSIVNGLKDGALIFETKNGYIEVLKLQPEGRNIMSGKDYLIGKFNES